MVLFTAGGVRGNREPQALISQTTKVLRARLAAAGVEFSMPLAPATATKPEPTGSSKGKADEVERPHGKAGLVKDNTHQSMVMVSGPVAVHGLFDFLYNETSMQPPNDDPCDVPTLLGPVAFEGATLHRPTIKVGWGFEGWDGWYRT